MFTVALDNVKSGVNLGMAVRAVACYGGDMVVYSGRRVKPYPTSVGHEHSVPILQSLDIFDSIPNNHVPVAIEFVMSALPLTSYVHPTHAYYIFGAEDNTLGKRVLDRCRDVVYIHTEHCMNLAACVNVVLYDRTAKIERYCNSTG